MSFCLSIGDESSQELSPVQFASCCESAEKKKKSLAQLRIPQNTACELQPVGRFDVQQPLPVDSSIHGKPFNMLQLQKLKNGVCCFVAHANEGKLNPRFSHRGIMEMSSSGFAFHVTLF